MNVLFFRFTLSSTAFGISAESKLPPEKSEFENDAEDITAREKSAPCSLAELAFNVPNFASEKFTPSRWKREISRLPQLYLLKSMLRKSRLTAPLFLANSSLSLSGSNGLLSKMHCHSFFRYASNFVFHSSILQHVAHSTKYDSESSFLILSALSILSTAFIMSTNSSFLMPEVIKVIILMR